MAEIPHIGKQRQDYWTECYNHARSMLLILRPNMTARHLDRACEKYADVKTAQHFGIEESN